MSEATSGDKRLLESVILRCRPGVPGLSGLQSLHSGSHDNHFVAALLTKQSSFEHFVAATGTQHNLPRVTIFRLSRKRPENYGG
jgi:hypothetical protein